MRSVAVIVAAAGASTRYAQGGGVRSKLDEQLGDRPVLQRTCEVFAKFEYDDWNIGPLVVAGPADERSWQEFAQRHGDRLSLLGATLVRGGTTHRYETVRNALEKVPASCTHIAVHDGARPCVSHALLSRVLNAAKSHPAVIPAMRVTETVKRVDEVAGPKEVDPLGAILGTDTQGATTTRTFVRETVPREGLMLVQTPQVFEASLLREAYAQSDLASTDDAGLVERVLHGRGQRVLVVAGESGNIKLTYPEDLALARNILGLKEEKGREAHKRF
jgi:2-C-methyl-D-erythritol 4-phosphate cytidylyltransferase